MNCRRIVKNCLPWQIELFALGSPGKSLPQRLPPVQVLSFSPARTLGIEMIVLPRVLLDPLLAVEPVEGAGLRDLLVEEQGLRVGKGDGLGVEDHGVALLQDALAPEADVSVRAGVLGESVLVVGPLPPGLEEPPNGFLRVLDGEDLVAV